MEVQEFRLPENHGWEARPGNRVFVANKGAVRFEIPNTWTLDIPKGGRSFQFFDRKPPHDDIVMELTIMYLAAKMPEVDWANLNLWTQPPIADFLKKSMAQDTRKPTKMGKPLTIHTGEMTFTWAEIDFMDPTEKRPAHSRTCYAMHTGAALMAIISMDFWHDDAKRARAIWNDVVGTLKMGEYIESPFHGPERRR